MHFISLTSILLHVFTTQNWLINSEYQQTHFLYSSIERQYRLYPEKNHHSFKPIKRQPQKLVKYTQTICRQQSTNSLRVLEHFVGLALKGSKIKWYVTFDFHWTIR